MSDEDEKEPEAADPEQLASSTHPSAPGERLRLLLEALEAPLDDSRCQAAQLFRVPIGTAHTWYRWDHTGLSGRGAGPVTTAPNEQYARKIEELSGQVERVLALMERGSKVEATEIEQLRSQVEQVAEAGQQLTAPILLPSREAMAVRLVSVGELERLEEYHADESRAYALFGVAAGAAAGMLINLATVPPDAPAPGVLFWLLFGVLCAVSGMYLFHAHTVRSRAKRLRREVVEAPTS